MNSNKEKIYKHLCQLFGKDDIICNKKESDEYPWICDFFIKSRKLYIEDFTNRIHHGHKFNKDNDVDIAILNQITSKEEKKYGVKLMFKK